MTKPLSENTRRRIADEAADELTRVANALSLIVDGRSVIDRIFAAMSPLRGTDFDPESNGATPWCWRHQQPVTKCWSDDSLCSGEQILVNDPTGEAALTPDKASHDLAVLDQALRHIHSRVRICFMILEQWAPRQAIDVEAALADIPDVPGCESCARIEVAKGRTKFSPPKSDKPTDVGGRLVKGRILCSACYKFTWNTGRLPTLAELRYYNKNLKWQPRHEFSGKSFPRTNAPRSIP